MSDDLVDRLRNTPNWLREGYQNWKDNVKTYDSAPFEAADRIEELEAENRKTRRETLRDHTLSEVLSAATVSELVAEIRRRDNPPKTDVKPRQLMEDQSDD